MARRCTVLVVALASAATLAFGAATAGAASSSDKKTAKKGVILTKDVPASWESSPPDNSTDDELERAAAQIPGCETYVVVRKTLGDTPKAESRSFATGSEEVSNEVWVFANTKKAKQTFALMSDDTVAPCLTMLFQNFYEGRVTDPSVAAIDVVIQQESDVGSVGDDIIGYGGGAQVTTTDGTVQRVPVSNAIVRVGRSILSYTFSGGPTETGVYTPAFVDGVENALIVTVDRIDKKLS